MSDTLTQSERAAIDAAVAAGKVRRVQMGGSVHAGYRWDGKQLVCIDPEMRKPIAQRNAERRKRQGMSPAVDARRAKVQSLVADGHGGVEIARMLGVAPAIVYADITKSGMKLNRNSAEVARSRYDENVERARSKVRDAYDGVRTVPQIAKMLGMADRTVRGHMQALGLARVAAKRGLQPDSVKGKVVVDRRAKVRELVAKGLRGPVIAETLKCSETVVYHDCKVMGLKIKPSEPKAMSAKAQIVWSRREEIPGLVAQGKRGSDLAKHFGVTTATIYNDCLAIGLTLTKETALSKAKSAIADAKATLLAQGLSRDEIGALLDDARDAA